jgi:hypothetical protein
MRTNTRPWLWLAADYHLPATYSCRLPMSSANSAPTSPGPGPATVRLALIRTSIELFGVEETRRLLFPSICSLSVQVRPPARVAISPHLLRAYKMEREAWGTRITEAPILREMAQADGPLTVYLRIPEAEADMWQQLLKAIGYWGQTSSLAWCVQVGEQVPSPQECIVPLRQWMNSGSLRPFYSCILSEFQDIALTWEDFLPVVGVASRKFLRLEVYLWPMTLKEQLGSGKVLVRMPFPASPSLAAGS